MNGKQDVLSLLVDTDAKEIASRNIGDQFDALVVIIEEHKTKALEDITDFKCFSASVIPVN